MRSTIARIVWLHDETPMRSATGQGRLEVGGGAGADRGEQLALVGVGVDIHDDRLGEAVLRLERLLELGVDAGCDGDGRAHDAERLRALQQA